jgi:hypothetical protein
LNDSVNTSSTPSKLVRLAVIDIEEYGQDYVAVAQNRGPPEQLKDASKAGPAKISPSPD